MLSLFQRNRMFVCISGELIWFFFTMKLLKGTEKPLEPNIQEIFKVPLIKINFDIHIYPYTKVTGCLSVCVFVRKDLANR